MSSPQETRFITSRTITTMGEHYADIMAGFFQCRDRLKATALDDGALGIILSRYLGPAYETARIGCDDALHDGGVASVGIHDGLDACAHNWRVAEQASIVEYR
jgi:hypothetical protein